VTVSSSSAATEADHDERPAALPGSLIGSLAFGTVLQALNSSMIAVALVPIRNDFHAGVSVNWLVSALYLATAVAAPTMGRLADLFGGRRMFLLGLVFVLVGAVAAPFSPNLGSLVACRVLLGLGTGAQYPCAVAILRKAADAIGARTDSALGALVICAQASIAFGPSLGGLLVGAFGWQGIFWVNVPMCAIAAIAVLRSVEPDGPIARPHPEQGRVRQYSSLLARTDPPGFLLFAAATTTLMLFLLSLAQTVQPIWVVVSVALFGVLVWWERRAANPFLDLKLLANVPLTMTYVRVTITYIAFYCIFYALPQWLEEARGLSAVQAGLMVLPIPIVAAVSTMLATRLQRRRGPTPTVLIGSGVLTIGGLLLTLADRGTAPILLLLIFAALGLPNGFNNMGNQSEMYQAAPPAQIGAASGLYRTCQYVGANLAAALLAVVLGENATDSGLHHTGLCVAVIAGAVLIATIIGAPMMRRARSASGAGGF
jgi:MFS family permease